MKRESWAGHSIRFVERSGEWWAVAQDVCEALGLKQVTRAMSSLKNVQQYNVCDLTNSQVTLCPFLFFECDTYSVIFK